MNRSTTAVIAASFLAAAVLAAPSASSAKNGLGPATKTEVKAHLAPCCGSPEPDAHGDADRKTVSKPAGIHVDHFSADVEIPAPSPGLGVTDPALADVRVVLSRESIDYAECFLRLDADETEGDEDDDAGATQAEFQVKVLFVDRHGSPLLKEIKGRCDVDLATAGVQPGVPDVEAGDVATASVVDPATSIRTPFLQGTFVAK